MESPKVFISYSWTTPEHEQRVLDIATELVDSGIDAILDKWDLKEVHDRGHPSSYYNVSLQWHRHQKLIYE